MRRVFSSLILAAVLGACGPPPAPNPPYPAGRDATRRPEPARSAASLDGEVLGVDRRTPEDTLASGMRVRVQTDSDTPVVVDLAPEWYLERHGLSFGKSDRVEVEGSYRQGGILYATRVRKAGRSLELRDTEGRPLWVK